MPRYRDTFKLDPRDLDLIEEALRTQAGEPAKAGERAERSRAIRDLLGRLHSQKIFFSHTRAGGIPNG